MEFPTEVIGTILYILCHISYCESTHTEISGEELRTLRQVQIIFRHGLRNPEKPYPGDPYANKSYWPEGWGSLTQEGKRQQYQLGKYIRKRYGNLISASYDPTEFYAVSSDSDRAIMSLLANLAGTFPPTAKSSWSTEIPQWQPIPIRTIPRSYDRIIRGTAPCPKFDSLWKNLLDGQEFKDSNAKFRDLYNRISEHTNESYTYPIDLTSFYEALIIQRAHNLSLPDWAEDILDSEESKQLLSFAFSLVVKTEEMKRLRGGPLLSELITNMKRRASNDSVTMVLYSGHDITLARIMDTLDIFNPPHIPDFNSALMIELHLNTSTGKTNLTEHFVEIYYKNGDDPEIKLSIPRCASDPCSLRDLEAAFKDRMIDTTWSVECNGDHRNTLIAGSPSSGTCERILLHGIREVLRCMLRRIN